ncbi:hypothetical protein V6Z11_A13G065700 [Gossypium hirsutum]|uniref:Ran-binding protein M homolog isoform X1 n=1 Tax=Gossypium hirsutum TaxID=3635 RepID=A0ABM2ZDZ4_GOSHI|nr:ran-binding protein M homolog isoform X1 [Gossypium hirsutum]XP_040940857.1 ran-binding protein M homolog isoform X1 [Gossypium hirsutum]
MSMGFSGISIRRLYRLGRMMELKGTRRAIFLRVHVNFGQKKFAFDVKEYEAQERLKQQMTIEKISLPPNISYGLEGRKSVKE